MRGASAAARRQLPTPRNGTRKRGRSAPLTSECATSHAHPVLEGGKLKRETQVVLSILDRMNLAGTPRDRRGRPLAAETQQEDGGTLVSLFPLNERVPV